MSFVCKVCDIVTNSQLLLNQHYAGAKHKRRAADPNFRNRTDQIKAAGLSYFVKAANASKSNAVQSQQVSTSNVEERDGRRFCSTCRLVLTSFTQAQVHYAGNKHRQKLELLKGVKSQGDGDPSQPPNFFCEICHVKVISQAQLDIHYTGNNHKQKCRILEERNASTAVPTKTIAPKSEVEERDGRKFCSTCRLVLTSFTQAQVHYAGNKHRQKLELLKGVKSQGDGDPSQLPNFFCEICHVKMTSQAQLDVHYTGNKHKQKCIMLEQRNASTPAPNNQIALKSPEISPFDVDPVADRCEEGGKFCVVCQITFTSMSQGLAHYRGAKHKNALRVLDEKKLRNSASGSSAQEDGEPSEKKAKFTEICETCNVKLLCPAVASAHYNGLKHAKKIMMLKDQGTASNKTTHPTHKDNKFYQGRAQNRPAPYWSNAPVPYSGFSAGSSATSTGVNKGGLLYCCFCDCSVNSQMQMDVHRRGFKHKANVERAANVCAKSSVSVPQAAVFNMRQVTNSYSFTDPSQDFSQTWQSVDQYGQGQW